MDTKQQPKPARSLFEPSSLGSRGLLPEDLPYAAEVEAALARRPSRGARWLSVSVFLFVAAFLVWASFAMLDEVTRADGQVIASSRTQIIQNLEGGILRSVEVYEGQIVEKGAVLARLDNETADGIMKLLTGINREKGTAIVMVTHNRQIFEKYPGRVMVCRDETCIEQKEEDVIDLELTI